jgi:hypothetical protein
MARMAAVIAAHVGVREKFREFLVEFRVPGKDNGHRSCHSLVDIAGRKRRLKERFGACRG